MADLTPEQEQEKLRILQQQNEEANKLLETRDKLVKANSALNNEENKFLGLTKQIYQSALLVDKNAQKILTKSTSINSILKTKITINSGYNKSLTDSLKLQEKELGLVRQINRLKNTPQKQVAPPIVRLSRPKPIIPPAPPPPPSSLTLPPRPKKEEMAKVAIPKVPPPPPPTVVKKVEIPKTPPPPSTVTKKMEIPKAPPPPPVVSKKVEMPKAPPPPPSSTPIIKKIEITKVIKLAPPPPKPIVRKVEMPKAPPPPSTIAKKIEVPKLPRILKRKTEVETPKVPVLPKVIKKVEIPKIPPPPPVVAKKVELPKAPPPPPSLKAEKIAPLVIKAISTTTAKPTTIPLKSSVIQEGMGKALKKFERSPSLGVTLDKDNSGLLKKLIGVLSNIFSLSKTTSKTKVEPVKKTKTTATIASKIPTPPVPTPTPVAKAKVVAKTVTKKPTPNTVVKSVGVPAPKPVKTTIKTKSATPKTAPTPSPKPIKTALGGVVNIKDDLDKLSSSEEIKELINTFRNIGAKATDSLGNVIKELKGDTKKVAKSIEQDLSRAFNKSRFEAFKINDLLKKQTDGSLKIANVTDLIERAKQRQLDIEGSIEEAISEGFISIENGNKIIQDSNDQFQIQQKLLKGSFEAAEKFEKKLGIAYKIFEGINKVPILNSLVNVKKVTDAMEESAGKGKSIWGVFGTGVSSTFKQIGKSLTDPLTIVTGIFGVFKKLFDLYGELDKRIIDQKRALTLTADQSDRLVKSAQEYADKQTDAFITEKRITEGRMKLNELLGTSIQFSEKEAITFQKMTHYYGVAEDSAAKLAELAREQGKDYQDILGTVVKTYVNTKAQVGTTLQLNKVIGSVANVSSDIYVKFKGNVAEMAKAVIETNRLGLSLEKVDQIGESLLNFESSIENELKAELLTGKSINLEKARAAALSGDSVKLAQEIAKEVGNIHKFEQMNVIQRKSYAEAFGMSVKDMGDMLRKQEFEAKLGEDAKKSATEQLRLAKEKGITIEESIQKELEQKSLQETQAEVFLKIKDILLKITSGPMKTFYHMLESALHKVTDILKAFGGLTGGGLGKGLGAALVGIPLAIMAAKMLSGGLRGLLFQKGTTLNPMVVTMVGGGMGMGGGIGMGKGMTLSAGAPMAQGLGPRLAPTLGKSMAPVTPSAGGGMGMMGRMGASMGLGIVGMGLSSAASNMEEGAGKTTVSALGGAANGAAIGMMFGPIGAGIGAAAGALWSLYSSHKESEAKKAAKEAEDKAKADEAHKQTQDLMRNLAVRPVQLQVNNTTIQDWNTASTQNGANSLYS